MLALSAGACAPAEEGPAGGPATVELWHYEVAANLETLERMVNRFNASQDEVRVRAVFQGNDEETVAKLSISLRGGQVPTIAYLSEVDAQKMIDSGAVTPVQEFIDRDGYDLSDLDPKATQYYTVDGKLWAMPISMAVPLLYYNKLTFREVGLDPEQPPRDLKELREYARRILTRDASGRVVRSGIALDISAWYFEVMMAEHGDLFADNNNGRDARATKVLFDNDTGRFVFQWWDEMVQEGLALNVGRNPSGAENLLAVGAGRAAITFSTSAALRSIFDVLEEGLEGVEVGVAPVPGVPGGTGRPGVYSRGLWVLNLRPEEEQEAAWKFITWFMEPEQQAEWFAGTGYLPVSRASVQLPAATDVVARYPGYRLALDLYQAIELTPASLGALLGPFREVREFVMQGIEDVVSGTRDPVAALENTATRSDAALAEYNERVQ